MTRESVEKVWLTLKKNLSEYLRKSLGTFKKISRNISKNLSEHSFKSLGTFE
ncbi:hypothetical protein HMPREF1869_00207 [Bacteroidales bacterium KA00251]|nr:hypothetical protein HMPREF1869_00207 [Bacteroidales bacterium KA00251]